MAQSRCHGPLVKQIINVWCCVVQRANGEEERGRVLHGVTRELWQASFEAHVPAATPGQVCALVLMGFEYQHVLPRVFMFHKVSDESNISVMGMRSLRTEATRFRTGLPHLRCIDRLSGRTVAVGSNLICRNRTAHSYCLRRVSAGAAAPGALEQRGARHARPRRGGTASARARLLRCQLPCVALRRRRPGGAARRAGRRGAGGAAAGGGGAGAAADQVHD